MVIVQDRSLRKASGGRNTSTKTKRLAQAGNNPSLTAIGSKRTRTRRVRGGNSRTGLLSAEMVNLLDPKSGKLTRAKLKEVKESQANRNYIRRNILTKGTVVTTDKGEAIITNRPGQEDTINAVLVTK